MERVNVLKNLMYVQNSAPPVAKSARSQSPPVAAGEKGLKIDVVRTENLHRQWR